MSKIQDLGPGAVLGRYELLAPIAAGGMAAVWAARQRGSHGFSKTVAIKMMLPEVSEDPRFEQMFLDEARIASRIRHGNVVEILDLGEERDLLYLVMEYVDCEPLGVMRRAAKAVGGIPLALSLKMCADAALGLHAAHELCAEDGTPLGLVHRDVSPQNILVGYDGRVKVTDFGIAKAAGRSAQTTGNLLKGKPAFMAPEQLQSAEIDRRSDLFALGIVLYQLVTNLHPFRGENDLATVKNILSKRPIQPPSRVNHEVGPELEATILRSLERDPDRRFQTGAEFERAIEEAVARQRRPRDQELAELMERISGPRRRERQQALQRAIERANQRLEGAEAQAESETPLAEIRVTLPPSSVQRPGMSTTGASLPTANTPLAAVYPAGRTSGGAGWLMAGVVAGLLLLGAGVVAVWVMPRSHAEAPAADTPVVAAPTGSPALQAVKAAQPAAQPDPATAMSAESARPAPVALPTAKPRPGSTQPAPPGSASASPSATASAEPPPTTSRRVVAPPVPLIDPGF